MGRKLYLRPIELPPIYARDSTRNQPPPHLREESNLFASEDSFQLACFPPQRRKNENEFESTFAALFTHTHQPALIISALFHQSPENCAYRIYSAPIYHSGVIFLFLFSNNTNPHSIYPVELFFSSASLMHTQIIL